MAMTSDDTSTKLMEVAERARREPNGQFFALAHLIDREALARAFNRLRPGAAAGVDGMTKASYGENLETNLEGLHTRMRTKTYRHQTIRRVHIEKGDGKTRPIGISTVEDKIVQGSICEVLEAIYEQDFLDCSYGFRPNRSAHDAIRDLNRILNRGSGNWVLEIDIKSFFDSLDRGWLRKMLQVRIRDGSMERLVGKCLKVGILDGEQFSWSEEGTAQGSSLSPLLGNVYLHYALDLWFEKAVKPRLKGGAHMVRYADDAVFTFERADEAAQFHGALRDRMAKFGLELHEDKTRLIDFRRPGQSGTPAETFDFLGFTHHWGKTRAGKWAVWQKTKRASRNRFLKRIYELCRDYRHYSVKAQHAALQRRVSGHFRYFGVNGNTRMLASIAWKVMNIWKKWLGRRSQKTRMTWDKFNRILVTYPIPVAKVYVQLWGRAPICKA